MNDVDQVAGELEDEAFPDPKAIGGRHEGRAFDEITARYFAAKCREALQDEDVFAAEASEAVALILMITAAELPRQVMTKIAVFEAEITAECDDGPWVDHRILPMFAGLKADLVRFGIGRRCQAACAQDR